MAGQSCKGGLGFDPAELAQTSGTIVLFMALAKLPAIAAALIEHGRDPTTPAAVIASGTRPGQTTVVAPLGDLPEAARALESPVLVVIGEVVALRETLAGLAAVSS